MNQIIRKTIRWGHEDLTIETGRIAKQADGAVLITYGGTVVLCTAVAHKSAKEGVDFFPLTVVYKEMSFAAGKIPGGYFKREGKPSEKDVLTSRLIDRPIRPCFNSNFFNETQVICTVLSYDMKNNPDIVALIGASAALSISGIPFLEPIAGSRIGYINDEFVLNPMFSQISDSKLDLVIAGTKSSVMMVESEANELSEEIMLKAVEFGHQQFQPVIKLIEELKDEAGKEMWPVVEVDTTDLDAAVLKLIKSDLKKAYGEKVKSARYALLDEMRHKVFEHFKGSDVYTEHAIRKSIKSAEGDYVRTLVVSDNVRIDGRGLSDIRKITCETGILPRTHGSALFTRGETQVLAVTTLGSSMDEQMIDGLDGDTKQNFMLHYNFPPYSVGEASQLKPPGRREIGHGRLALRSFVNVMPSKEEFPYTVRVVAEVTECNGSSSMGTICSSSLSMMQAGIPLKAAVAGIAMGLVKEGKSEVILSDIMGDEDHLGDMDFKVAGTEQGVTALQMDIKVAGISFDTMKKALAQAKEGRLFILSEMNKVLDQPADTVNQYAPVITTIKISVDKIREVIGSGGKVIRGLCEETGSKIEIEDDGTVRIAAPNTEVSELTIKKIMEIAVEPEAGKIYDGVVVKLADFGAFVRFLGAREGLVHISEIQEDHVVDISDVISEGRNVKVKVIGFDPRGKVKLSMRVVDQNTGEDLSGDDQANFFGAGNKRSVERPEKSDRGDRGDRKRSGPGSGGRGKPRDSERSGRDSDRGNRGDSDRPQRHHHDRGTKPERHSKSQESGNGEQRKFYN
jgi:polyribonucleotide nucleotidyltransferase